MLTDQINGSTCTLQVVGTFQPWEPKVTFLTLLLKMCRTEEYIQIPGNSWSCCTAQLWVPLSLLRSLFLSTSPAQSTSVSHSYQTGFKCLRGPTDLRGLEAQLLKNRQMFTKWKAHPKESNHPCFIFHPPEHPWAVSIKLYQTLLPQTGLSESPSQHLSLPTNSIPLPHTHLRARISCAAKQNALIIHHSTLVTREWKGKSFISCRIKLWQMPLSAM